MNQKAKYFFLIIVLFSACTAQRMGTKLATDAHRAFENQQYEAALGYYEQFIISEGNDATQVPDSIYRDAGLAAFYLDQSEKALNYLNTIRHSETANGPTHYALAILNRQIDNLSREITALESYVENHPDGEHIQAMRNRLFETWVESRNYQHALDLWPEIEHYAREDEGLLNNYFIALQELQKEEELNAVARELLALNPENTDALDHLARYYFWRAENRYQKEMEAYEKNRTHRQYAQLLKAFDVLNKDFRTALGYFLTLYEIDPQPTTARFIGNIYLRFDDKERARFYHNKAE